MSGNVTVESVSVEQVDMGFPSDFASSNQDHTVVKVLVNVEDFEDEARVQLRFDGKVYSEELVPDFVDSETVELRRGTSMMDWEFGDPISVSVTENDVVTFRENIRMEVSEKKLYTDGDVAHQIGDLRRRVSELEQLVE